MVTVAKFVLGKEGLFARTDNKNFKPFLGI
jgi:hypothetical protein